MTEQEFKQSIESMQNEVKSANAKAADLATRLSEKETEISNLDATAKEQQKSIDELKGAIRFMKTSDFKGAFRAALESKKDDIQKMFDQKAQRFDVSFELKDVTSIGTSHISPNNRLGVADDPTIYAAVPASNAFLAVFGVRPRPANKLGWIESTHQPTVDYVAELAQNTNKSDASFTEKTRAFGKLATYMTISTEFEDWFESLYNYCVNDGVRMIEDKLDTEVYSGAGDDATYPNKIYGVKGAATAFSALAANAIIDANEADVILDSADQIRKEGFNPTDAFVTWAIFRTLKGLKDANGNYLFDQVKGLLNGIAIHPSSRLSAGEILVADKSCAEVYAGNGYELEFIRNGAYDAYDVYFRKAAQVRVPTSRKKGLIYVSSVTTAKAALLKSTSND